MESATVAKDASRYSALSYALREVKLNPKRKRFQSNKTHHKSQLPILLFAFKSKAGNNSLRGVYRDVHIMIDLFVKAKVLLII